MEGFEQIRFQVSERSGSIYGSDIVNGLLYNGVPSNHFGMMLVGAFICLQINWYDPWPGWWLGALMFALIASVFAFSVIYLGEHYPLDMVASAIVYPIGITVFNIILEAIIPFPAS
jgi:membrane-associated phospholipid phosphatase